MCVRECVHYVCFRRCICVCVHVYVCIRFCMFGRVCVHVHMYVCIYYVCLCVDVWMCTCMCVFIIYVCVGMYVCVHVCIHYICLCMSVCACIYVHSLCMLMCTFIIYVCIGVYVEAWSGRQVFISHLVFLRQVFLVDSGACWSDWRGWPHQECLGGYWASELSLSTFLSPLRSPSFHLLSLW